MRFAAVVLAGGHSSRMGRDKAEMMIGGKRAVDMIADRLNIFDEILISSDKDIIVDNCRNIPDVYKEKGPASGILSALRYIESDALFVTTCDMPLIRCETVKNMCELYYRLSKNIDAVVLKDEYGINPLFAVYSRDTEIIFENAILSGLLSVKKILDKMRVYVVNPGEISGGKNEFLSMNTPNEYETIKKVYYENGVE